MLEKVCVEIKETYILQFGPCSMSTTEEKRIKLHLLTNVNLKNSY